MLQEKSKQYQWLQTADGSSTQHTRDIREVENLDELRLIDDNCNHCQLEAWCD
jgi:hypothetical protein